MDCLLQTLQAKFRLAEFRPRQREIIEDVLARRDTLCVMPTGAGKSLCFQLPAVLRGGLTIVISPLISLMADQVRQLKQLGIPAFILNSTQTPTQQREIVRQLVTGFEGLLYIAPERFAAPSFQALAKQLRPWLFVVDEAHCISSWGHDFRPDYMRLAAARQLTGNPICLAVTATATPQVRQDIGERLGLRSPRVHVTGFDRPNLNYTCQDFADEARKDVALVEFVKGHAGSGIVYCSTRKKTEAVAALLEERLRARVVVCYHGGMELAERQSSQSLFMRANEAVAVATNAFGMGINKPDIRFVLHYNLPGSIEAYYQEAGRAGRDGEAAECRLLYQARDRRTQEFFIDKMGENNPDMDSSTLATLREHATSKLWKMVDYASKPVCRRRQILDYFGDSAGVEHCDCDVCATSAGPGFGPGKAAWSAMMIRMPILRAVAQMETGSATGVGELTKILRGDTRRLPWPGHLKARTGHPSTPGSAKAPSHVGALAGHRRDEVVRAIQHTVEEGLLRQEDVGNRYRRPVIKLAERGRELITMHPTPAPNCPRRATGDFEQCFKRLRVWRSGIAKQRGIAAFCIFHDSTLKKLAEEQPTTMEQLHLIPGMGPKKLADYGRAVLAAIAEK